MKRFEKILKNRFAYTVWSLIRNYLRHEAASRSAELAYYLLFALFPLTIFVSLALAGIKFDIAQVEALLEELMPSDISGVICDLLENIKSLNLDALMYTGLFGALYAMLRAVLSLGRSMDLAYDVPKRRNPILQFLISLAMAGMLLVLVVIALIVVLATPNLLERLSRIFGIESEFPELWTYIRYILIAGILFCDISILYFVVPNRRIRLGQVLPGAAAAVMVWLPATAGFSYYVENMSRYTLLYGSVGAIIILLLWLYLTGIVLIMGAELNSILMELRQEKTDGSPSDRRGGE